MKLFQHILALLFMVLALTHAQDDDIVSESNTPPWCNNGDNGVRGAKRTCIESPEFNGKRCFFTYIPECAGEDSPLVYDLHGYTSCPTSSRLYTGWKDLADEHCFVIVYALGTIDATITDASCWYAPGGLLYNDGNDIVTTNSCCCVKENIPVPINDGAFLRQVAAVSVREIPEATSGKTTIDTKRIYMGGHSNGCMMSISMAAQHSDMVAAVGCHAGTALTNFSETYSATPMAFIHGTSDAIVPYIRNEIFPGAQQYLSIISRMNGCTQSTFNTTTGYLGTSNNVTEYRSSNCTNDADVVLYALENVGHRPFVILSQQGYDEPGTSPTEFNTTQLMWDFVSKYSLEAEPELVLTVIPDTMVPTAAPTAKVSLNDHDDHKDHDHAVIPDTMVPTAAPTAKVSLNDHDDHKDHDHAVIPDTMVPTAAPAAKVSLNDHDDHKDHDHEKLENPDNDRTVSLATDSCTAKRAIGAILALAVAIAALI